jgi:hypothetical protein
MKMNIQIRAIGLSQRHNAAKSINNPANCVNLKNKSEILTVDNSAKQGFQPEKERNARRDRDCVTNP